MKWVHITKRASDLSVELFADACPIILMIEVWIFLVLSFFDSSLLMICLISWQRSLLDLMASSFWVEMGSYSHSTSTHGHNFAQCYSCFSQHHTTHRRKTGALTAPTQHLCTNGHQHHPAPLESSSTLTFNGLIQNQPHAERSLATLTLPQLPVYTHSNLWDSALPKPLAHFHAQQPVTFSLPVHKTFHLYTFLTSEDTYNIRR